MQTFFESLKQKTKNIINFIKEKSQPLAVRLVHLIRKYFQVIWSKPRMRLAIITAAFPLLFIAIALLFVLTDTPGKDELKAFRNAIPSEVYTADSVLIGRYYVQERRPVKYEQISPAVIEAVLATEDIRFLDHSGIDYRSLGRVAIKSILLQDESSGGGSTLTQQLAKNIFPRKDYWILSIVVNKLREAVIAMRMESIYSKKELLTLYLNTIPFGDNTYGIEAAADRFFSVKAKDLSYEQAAVLIGMLKATHSYNPRLFPDESRQRRNVVLGQLKKYNMITADIADSLQKLPLKLQLGDAPGAQRFGEVAPYFREYLKTELLRWCENNKKPDGTPYNLYTDGLKVYTTIDSKLQRHAEEAVKKQMSGLQDVFFNHWEDKDPWGDNEAVVMDALKRTNRYKTLKQKGLSEKEIIEELNKPVSTRLFTWTGPKEAKLSPLDSIKHHLKFLNAGFLAMDPKSGEVKAWVGGINHDFFQYDHVKVTTKRQVGSVFKPIVYAQAIDEGVSPCEFIPAGQQTYVDDEGELWTPRNTQYDYPVEYSMRGALAYSVNTVSVKLINRAGIDNTIKLARNMGIESEIPDVPSIALGSSAISLMEMTAAYACFANEGVASYPYFIRVIEDREGNRYENFKPKISGRQALSKETALMVRHMLQTVVQEGTGARLRYKYGVYNDVAGKTGTTQANADGWFMAFTPELVMGSWVGADDPRIRFRYTKLGEGSNTALPIVAYFLKEINNDPDYKNIAKAKFPSLPSEVRRRLNCDLYEINDDLWMAIEKSIHQRDSVIQADTLAPEPPETFLQVLYNRKRKITLVAEERERPSASAAGTSLNR